MMFVKHVVLAFILALSYLITLTTSTAITESVCEACCALALDGLPGFEDAACDAGCLDVVTEAQITTGTLDNIVDPFLRAACNAHKDECKVGLDWISFASSSRTVTSNGDVLDGSIVFCVSPGNFSGTNAPSASPTTPAPVPPTGSPTREPTVAPAKPIDDGIDYVAPLAGGLGAVAGLAAIMYGAFWYTKRKYVEEQKGFERKEGKGWISSDAKPVVAPPRPKVLGPPPGLGPPGLGPPGIYPASNTFSSSSYGAQTNSLRTAQTNSLHTVPPENVVFVYEDEEGGAQSANNQLQQQPEEENLQKPFKAIADFDPEHSDELKITEGEEIMGIRQIDENWWLAEVDGRRGIVPLNFLEEVDL